MALSMIGKIEEAEQEAARIVQEARREAGDIVKSVEDAITVEDRQSMRELHEETQGIIEKARVGVLDEIKALEVRRGLEREAVTRAARTNIPEAAKAVFERIVEYGAR